MALTVEIGEASSVANGSSVSPARSAAMRRITDGIREEMMVAMLDLMQGAASACADICTQRLRTLHEQMLQHNQSCQSARLGEEAHVSASTSDNVVCSLDGNDALENQSVCDADVSINAMYEDWGAVIHESNQARERDPISASKRCLHGQGIARTDLMAWFDAEVSSVASPVLFVPEQVQEVAKKVEAAPREVEQANAGSQVSHLALPTTSASVTGETAHKLLHNEGVARSCRQPDGKQMSCEPKPSLLSGLAGSHNVSVGSASDSDTTSVRSTAGSSRRRGRAVSACTASSGGWEGNLRSPQPGMPRSSRCWRPELTRPSSPRLQTQHRPRRSSRSQEPSRPSGDEREVSAEPRRPLTARGERAAGQRQPAVQPVVPRRTPLRGGRAESFTSARSRSQSAASSDAGRSECTSESVVPVRRAIVQGAPRNAGMSAGKDAGTGVDTPRNSGMSKSTEAGTTARGAPACIHACAPSAPSGPPAPFVRSVPTPARSAPARPTEVEPRANAARHVAQDASGISQQVSADAQSLDSRAASCEAQVEKCVESRAESRAELARRQALARLKSAQMLEKAKLCVFKSTAVPSHESN